MQVIDCGSQYTQKIYERLARLGYALCTEGAPAGYIISGGPESVIGSELIFNPDVFKMGKPVLGICYGMQAMAQVLGGRVDHSRHQYGVARVHWKKPIFELQSDFQVWMSHGDTVVELPPGFDCLATSGKTIAAMADDTRHFWGVQWHPEVEQSEYGSELLAAFAQLCGLQAQPVPNLIEQVVQLSADLKDDALIAVSGGVDSTTLALLYKESGRSFVPVFIDNGLLREGEAEQVGRDLKALLPNLVVLNAQQQFLDALDGLREPDDKRKAIGRVFGELLAECALKYECKYLGQGTLLSDVIESGTFAHSARIKRHHNVGGLPKDYALPLVEPFRGLFKHRVREIATALGLPKEINQRMPFPGPGLAIRILGNVTAERLCIVRAADAIYQDELVKRHLTQRCSQAFASLLDSNVIGVAGDSQRYDQVVSLRAVLTSDFMTASVVPLPIEALIEVGSRIQNEVKGVGRVMYDLSSKPPATIELS